MLRMKERRNSQDLHVVASHPPQVGVEHNDINTFPIPTMLVNGALSHDPVGHPMDDCIVRVGLQKKWGPVELNGRIVVL